MPATNAATPPAKPPFGGRRVGGEFPEGDRENYIIDGHEVSSYTLKYVEAGQEKDSYVYVEVENDDVKHAIRQALKEHSLFTSDLSPSNFSGRDKEGIWVSSTTIDLSADQIHDLVRKQLEFLQSKQRVPSDERSSSKTPRPATVSPAAFQDKRYFQQVVLNNVNMPGDNPDLSVLMVQICEAAYNAIGNSTRKAITLESLSNCMQDIVNAMAHASLNTHLDTVAKINTAVAKKVDYVLGHVPIEALIKRAFQEHILPQYGDSRNPTEDQINAEATFYGSLHSELHTQIAVVIGPSPDTGKGKGAGGGPRR